MLSVPVTASLSCLAPPMEKPPTVFHLWIDPLGPICPMVPQLQPKHQVPILLEAGTLPERLLQTKKGWCPHGGCSRKAVPGSECWSRFHPNQCCCNLCKLLVDLDHAPPPDHQRYGTEIRLHFVKTIQQSKPHRTIAPAPRCPLFEVTLQRAISAQALYHFVAPLFCLSYQIIGNDIIVNFVNT